MIVLINNHSMSFSGSTLHAEQLPTLTDTPSIVRIESGEVNQDDAKNVVAELVETLWSPGTTA